MTFAYKKVYNLKRYAAGTRTKAGMALPRERIVWTAESVA